MTVLLPCSLARPPPRLDRLISLLETGSNAQIKSTAAKQLGEIARRTFGVGGSSIEGGARPSISPDSTTADIKPNKDALNSDTAALGSGLEMDAEWAEVMDLIGRVSCLVSSLSTRVPTALNKLAARVELSPLIVGLSPET